MVGQEVTRDARSHGAVFGGRGERVEVVARPPRGTGNVPTKKKLNAQKRDKKVQESFAFELKWGNGEESAISYVTVSTNPMLGLNRKNARW